MRSPFTFACAITAWALAACTTPSDPLPLAAGEDPTPSLSAQARDFEVVALSSPGGAASQGRSLTNHGWVAGFARDPDGATQQAVVWRNGVLTELGTLGGPNSSVVWPGQNQEGIVVGISETSDLDPEGPNFSCFFFFPGFPEHSGHICRGFAWDGNGMRDLPTLGGSNSFATGVNAAGQIVGWAENTVRDPTCLPGSQVLQFRAVVWGPEEGRIQELPPLPGDSVSAATAINSRGQVVGISGHCDQAVGRHSARHAVLWDRGQVVDLGSLGASVWNTPMDINDRGDVVGFAGPPPHEGGGLRAFISTPGEGIREIKPLEGCAGTHQANSINERRQVVGVATGCADDRTRAFLWEAGETRDLNSMVPSGTGLWLLSAQDINERGQITGSALDAESGEVVPFLATPRSSFRAVR